MNSWLNKLHERCEEPGLETRLLKRMPAIFIIGSLSPAVVAGLSRLMLDASAARQIASIDIFLIAAVVTFWTAVVTVTIACVIISVMKGPGYVADAYALDEASRPKLARDQREARNTQY